MDSSNNVTSLSLQALSRHIINVLLQGETTMVSIFSCYFCLEQLKASGNITEKIKKKASRE
jgi:hypothetical protein